MASILALGSNHFSSDIMVMLTAVEHSTQLFPVTALILFATLGWITSLGFEALRDQLSALIEAVKGEKGQLGIKCLSLCGNNDAMETMMMSRLRKWKQQHVLLCDTTERINQCFGFVLLVWVSHVFVSFISTSFYFINSIFLVADENRALQIISIALFIQQSVHILLLTVVPSKLQREVRSTSLSYSIHFIRFICHYVVGYQDWETITTVYYTKY